MTRPIERHQQLIEEILAKYDLSHDFGRKMAYEAAIEHAREHLADDPHCNDFLRAVANRLGFQPVVFDTIESRVKLRKGAWLDAWISDEDDEVAITGTREGLQYVIDVLTHLRNSTEPGEHVHLDRGIAPLTDNSAHLVFFKEDESWFTGAPEDLEPYPPRDIEPSQVFAFQTLQYPPEGLAITPHRLYRVTGFEPAPEDDLNVKDFPEGDPKRYYLFRFRNDGGQAVVYGFHLDDPGMNFFTHKEVMSLVMGVEE
jgi:hypothetical protein